MRNGKSRTVRRETGPRRGRAASRPWLTWLAAGPRPWLAWLAAGGLLSGCASGRPPDPPGPVSVEAPREGSERGPAAAGETPAVRLPAPPHSDPPRPWIPPAVRWEPGAPAEGSALALWLEQPAGGRWPLSVEAELAGARVNLIPVPGGWFGVAALPIGSGGTQLLTLRFRTAPGSTDQRIVPLQVASREYATARLRIGSRFTQPSPETLERLERERRSIRATLEGVTSGWLAGGGFEWPRLSRVTSPFGQRRVLNGRVRTRHLGLDLAGRPGEPVRAAGAGRVALTGNFLLQGNAVFVDHGLGAYTAYFHLSRIHVREGETVVRGQLLGTVGSTGRVTGPHLHWSLYVGGESVDPESLLRLRVPDPSGVEESPGRTAAGREP